jgi:hypothetical protein
MSSRFIQGDGEPVLSLYDSTNTLLDTFNMPDVKDDGNSYIRQYFDPYPKPEYTAFELLSGNIGCDPAAGYRPRFVIRYPSILASDLKAIYDLIIRSYYSLGYLKLKPRSDSAADYKVVYKGSLSLESTNGWRHNVQLDFQGMEMIKIENFNLTIPA